MNRRVLIGGAILVLPMLALLVAGLGRDPNTIESPLVGRDAPPFELKQFDSGQRISLEDLQGRPAVINFWASWCAPCYVEHPVLVEASRRLGDDVQFVGVIYEDSNEAIARFLQQFPPFGPTLEDPEGRMAIAWGVYGAPETFFLDPKGRVVAKHAGALTPELLDQYLRLAGGPSS